LLKQPKARVTKRWEEKNTLSERGIRYVGEEKKFKGPAQILRTIHRRGETR